MSRESKFNDLTSPAWGRIPDYMRDGIAGYVLRGEPIGDFLEAVFSNDLVRAYGRADQNNTEVMRDYAELLYNGCPMDSWGSKEKVAAWQKAGGLAGREFA